MKRFLAILLMLAILLAGLMVSASAATTGSILSSRNPRSSMTLISSRLLNLWEKALDGTDNYELVDNMDIGNQLNDAGRSAMR